MSKSLLSQAMAISNSEASVWTRSWVRDLTGIMASFGLPPLSGITEPPFVPTSTVHTVAAAIHDDTFDFSVPCCESQVMGSKVNLSMFVFNSVHQQTAFRLAEAPQYMFPTIWPDVQDNLSFCLPVPSYLQHESTEFPLFSHRNTAASSQQSSFVAVSPHLYPSLTCNPIVDDELTCEPDEPFAGRHHVQFDGGQSSSWNVPIIDENYDELDVKEAEPAAPQAGGRHPCLQNNGLKHSDDSNTEMMLQTGKGMIL